MIRHKLGRTGRGFDTTEIYADVDPRYLQEARCAIDEVMSDLARKVNGPRTVFPGPTLVCDQIATKTRRTRPVEPDAQSVKVVARKGVRMVGAAGIEPATPKMSTSRSEERRVGKEVVSTCRSRLCPDH